MRLLKAPNGQKDYDVPYSLTDSKMLTLSYSYSKYLVPGYLYFELHVLLILEFTHYCFETIILSSPSQPAGIIVEPVNGAFFGGIGRPPLTI